MTNLHTFNDIFGLFLSEILGKVIITCVDKHFIGYILTKKDALSSKFISFCIFFIPTELRHLPNLLRNSLVVTDFRSIEFQEIISSVRSKNPKTPGIQPTYKPSKF